MHLHHPTIINEFGNTAFAIEHFIECAREKNCLKVKAITRPTNTDSIRFHRSIGMKLVGKDAIDGFNVVLDYAGPAEHRVLFMKEI